MTQTTNGQFADELPRSIEAESALLGSILHDPERALPAVANQVQTNDFYKPAHAVIFDQMQALHANGSTIDAVMLVDRLRDAGQFDKVGGTDYVIELAESVPSASSAEHYAGIVAEKSRARRLADACDRAYRRVMGEHDSPDAVADSIERELLSLSEANAGDRIGQSIGDDVAAVYDALERQGEQGQPQVGIPTGIPDLDFKTGGLRAGQMVTVAATTGAGKSAFALHVADHIASRQQTPVAWYSLEMTRQQGAERLLSLYSGVDLKVCSGARTATRDDFAALAEARGRLADLAIYPVEARQLTADRLRSSARWLHARHGVGCIIIDYLQLMAPPSRENRNQEIASLSRAVKLLALELEIPVLCLSQLNRESVKEGTRRPRLSDLRDSGAIEQDSDVVLFLHDPNKPSESPAPGYEPEQKDIELIVAKQRQGPVGTIQLRFDGATQRFKNMTKVGAVEMEKSA